MDELEKKYIRLTETELNDIVKESIRKILGTHRRTNDSIEELTKVLCDRLKGVLDYDRTLRTFKNAISCGYSLADLWRMYDDDDHTKLYDIIFRY